MSRTYIGPFGRILPVPDDKEPERQQFPVDETRTNMTTYQLPPPDRLQFGSDASPGFTEPMRYNTIGQQTRSQQPSISTYSEHSRQIRQEQLPSVRQLLTPTSKSTGPPSQYPFQYNPTQQQRRSSTNLDHRNSLSDQTSRISQPSDQPVYPRSQEVPQAQQPTTVSPQRDSYQISPSTRHYSPMYNQQQGSGLPSYSASLVSAHQAPYRYQPQPAVQSNQPQHQHIAPLDRDQFQQMLPVNTTQSQQLLPTNPSTQYYQSHVNHYDSASIEMTSEHSPPSATSNVKPQPRVVGEQDVPGEGPSWVYEDGTTCKKIIDGEAVNAQWGITKAGKPRKRLAIACTTCREKKIKCDPAEPKCVQCEKFGRECRFTTAFRNQRGSPDSPSYDSQARTPLVKVKSETPPCSAKYPSISKSPLPEDSKAFKRRNSSPETSHAKGLLQSNSKASTSKAASAKRQRSSFPGLFASKADRKHRSLKAAHTHPEFRSPNPPWDKASAKVELPSFDWENDPYQVDQEITGQYLENYFTYINNATYQMFPRKPFLNWVYLSERKSPGERMTLYALLAVGSIFSKRPDREYEDLMFARIAERALEQSHSKFTLHLAHSRLLLSLYNFSIGETQKAWDFGGAAIRAASGLRFNLENECCAVNECDEIDYGLEKAALAECRRRCFWAAYMADKFSGFCSGHMCMLQIEDIYLRLPCEETIYEAQEYAETPFLNNGVVDRKLCQSTGKIKIGSMAFSVQISSIWSDVLSRISRSSHQSQDTYQADLENLYMTSNQRLSSWMQSLPPHLLYSQSNLASCVSDGNVGVFVSLHAVYHTAIMKLNRNNRYSLLPASTFARYITTALEHARQLLQMIQTIESITNKLQACCTTGPNQQNPNEYAFSTPFVGYAILAAVDIISAGGALASCPDTILMIQSTLTVFERLNRFWASARIQSKAVQMRLDQLTQYLKSKSLGSKRAWKCKNPLDVSFGKGQDLLYTDDDMQGEALLHCLKVDVRREDIVLVD